MVRTVKKPEERRKEIVSAARTLFLEQEYEKTSMQDVMQKVGIAKGTIYHYFKSKDELLDAVVSDIVGEYIARVKSSLEKLEGTAMQRMRALIESSSVAENQSELLEQMHRPGNIGLHARQLAAVFSQLAPLYAGVIEQGCKEGVFTSEHPLETAEFLLAGIQFLTDVGCYPCSHEDIQRRTRAIPALIEAQLRAPKGSFDFLV